MRAMKDFLKCLYALRELKVAMKCLKLALTQHMMELTLQCPYKSSDCACNHASL